MNLIDSFMIGKWINGKDCPFNCQVKVLHGPFVPCTIKLKKLQYNDMNYKEVSKNNLKYTDDNIKSSNICAYNTRLRSRDKCQKNGGINNKSQTRSEHKGVRSILVSKPITGTNSSQTTTDTRTLYQKIRQGKGNVTFHQDVKESSDLTDNRGREKSQQTLSLSVNSYVGQVKNNVKPVQSARSPVCPRRSARLLSKTSRMGAYSNTTIDLGYLSKNKTNSYLCKRARLKDSNVLPRRSARLASNAFGKAGNANATIELGHHLRNRDIASSFKEKNTELLKTSHHMESADTTYKDYCNEETVISIEKEISASTATNHEAEAAVDVIKYCRETQSGKSRSEEHQPSEASHSHQSGTREKEYKNSNKAKNSKRRKKTLFKVPEKQSQNIFNDNPRSRTGVRKAKKPHLTLKYLKERDCMLQKDLMPMQEDEDDIFSSLFRDNHKNLKKFKFLHLDPDLDNLNDYMTVITPKGNKGSRESSALTPRTNLFSEWRKSVKTPAKSPVTPLDEKAENKQGALTVMFHHLNNKPKKHGAVKKQIDMSKISTASVSAQKENVNLPVSIFQESKNQDMSDSSFDEYFPETATG